MKITEEQIEYLNAHEVDISEDTVSHSDLKSGIIRIKLKGYAGYGPIDDAFEDCLIITADSIRYECRPEVEDSTSIKHVKWNYKTDNPIFADSFTQLAKAVPHILEQGKDVLGLDCGGTDVIAFFEDGHKESVTFWGGFELLAELYRYIRFMIPQLEPLPMMFSALDDEEDEEEDGFRYMETPRSTCFSRVGYNAEEEILYAEFRDGDSYLYYDFPQNKYEEFAAAESMGNYFQQYIRDQYEYDLA